MYGYNLHFPLYVPSMKLFCVAGLLTDLIFILILRFSHVCLPYIYSYDHETYYKLKFKKKKKERKNKISSIFDDVP